MNDDKWPEFVMVPCRSVLAYVEAGDISVNAGYVYLLLLTRVNKSRGDSDTWPSRKWLATKMHLSRPQSVDMYIAELESVGLIKKTKQKIGGMRARNRYELTDVPALRSAPDRTTSRAGKTGDSAGGDVVRSSAPRCAPQRTRVVRSSAQEPKEEELEEVEQEKTSPLPPAHADGPTPRQRGRDGKEKDRKPKKPGAIDQHDLNAAAYVASNPPETGGAFQRLTDSELERLTSAVARQFRAGITRSQINTAIGERNLEGVTSIIATLISRINKLEPVPVKPQRRQVPECGQCQSRWVPVIDDEGHERWAPCPTCSPQAMAKAAA